MPSQLCISEYTHYRHKDGSIRRRNTHEHLLGPEGGHVHGSVTPLAEGGWLVHECTNQLFLEIPCTKKTVQLDGESRIVSAFGKQLLKEVSGSLCSQSLSQLCNPIAGYYYNSLTMQVGVKGDHGSHSSSCKVMRVPRDQHPRLPVQNGKGKTGTLNLLKGIVSGRSSMRKKEANAINAAKFFSAGPSMSQSASARARELNTQSGVLRRDSNHSQRRTEEAPRLPTHAPGRAGPSLVPRPIVVRPLNRRDSGYAT